MAEGGGGGGGAPGGEGGDDPMMTENGFDGSPRVKAAGATAKVDAAVLQYQNQKLVQKLEVQKSEMHALEGKFKELKDKQISYDKTLITVNRIWNQLVDDLVLLGIRAGGNSDGLLTLDHKNSSTETVAAFPPEEIFLHRLLKTHSTENNKENGTIKYVQDALALRHSSTMNLMEHLLETINVPRTKTESLQLALRGNISLEDAIMKLQKLNDSLKEQANNMRQAVEVIHQKQKQYADEIDSYFDCHKRDQSEIKRLSGELEESMAELEESRRKLVILQMQKHGTSVMNTLVANAVNGSNSLDKPEDRTMSLRELKISVEEAKALAASRLAELQEAQEDKSILSKQLEELQNELVDEKYIFSSKPYSLLNQQLQDLNQEIDRYTGFIESLQADRNNLLRREKELSAKVESTDAANGSIINHDDKIKELELQVQKLITERNDLEMKFEEADQDSGRKDIKDEFRVMSSALSKEMEMMETQLNRYKEAAYEALSLREEANSLRGILNKKISEQKTLFDRCAEQLVEIKSLKALIKELEKGRQELESFLDMYGQESCDNRTIVEIKESEHRALTQAEILRNALDEHSLELRVKAANEAEAACQQRLSVAEVEIEELRVKLDASEREILELTESVRIKDAEAETYISEIETIGQAYEDMQTQNQHLLQQVADRDNYNIKLVSNSMKMKQIHSSLLSDKQALIKQLQQLNETLEPFKVTVARIDEQVNTLLVQATTASSKNRSLSIHLERANLDLTNAEKEVKWLRSAIDSSEEEYKQNQKKVHELGVDVGRERNERKKLEEELQELKGGIVEMSPENEEAAIQKLQDEIKECKAILKCGVCFDRPKEVLITKCFHLFCSPCIQRNLEIRHRKCPGCGTPFGQSDVREVNI